MCTVNHLVIGGTIFQPKEIHKRTGNEEDGDLHANRIPDVGSDHNLVIGRIILNLSKAETGSQRKLQYVLAKSKEPAVKHLFQIDSTYYKMSRNLILTALIKL